MKDFEDRIRDYYYNGKPLIGLFPTLKDIDYLLSEIKEMEESTGALFEYDYHNEKLTINYLDDEGSESYFEGDTFSLIMHIVFYLMEDVRVKSRFLDWLESEN